MAENEEKLLLLVEDNKDHAQLAEFYIHEYDENIVIKHLQDGGEAMNFLEKLEKNKMPLPWLVLLDLKLPKYDGHEILARIKTSSTLSKIPVIIFSTSTSFQEIEKALNMHANSYIVKPTEANKYSEIMNIMLSYWQKNQHHQLQYKGRLDA